MKGSWLRAAYAGAGLLAMPPAFALAGAGALLSKRWRPGLAERLGKLPEGIDALVAKSPRLWVHCASIGEVRAAHPLLAAIRARWPSAGLLVTTTSPEGNALAKKLAIADAVGMLPLDLPGLPGRLLDAARPDALVLLETELWPGLLAAARRRLIPALVVNGRISARSFGRYAAAKSVLGPVLDDVAVFAMQAEVDATRIRALGADPSRVSVVGNLKYDALALSQPAVPAALAPLARETVWIAGSTHDGEEIAVADAHKRLQTKVPGLRLVVAPRHLKRVEEAKRALESRGLTVVLRTRLDGAPPPAGAAVLLDTTGELAGAYALATAVFVGGSLLPRGGHNPLEPLAHGRPVTFGPFTQNFLDVSRVVLESGGGKRVADAGSLALAVEPWLADPSAARETGAKAKRWILERHGAVAGTLAILARWLGDGEETAARPSSWTLPAAGRPIAGAAAAVYRAAVGARRRLYDSGAFPVSRASRPVIALGGIVAGGTGKTPAVVFLAKRLAEGGARVAVVSRGYRGATGSSPVVVSSGHGPEVGAEVAGDEPVMIARRSPRAIVIAHPDRVAGARAAEALGADLILLDDGFQHRRLARDLDLVLLDAASPLGNGRFLPAGPLRDLPERLSDASLLLLTRADLAGPAAVARAAARLSLVSAAPVARFVHRITGFEDAEGRRVAKESLTRAYAFSGLADPEAFRSGLAREAIAILGHHAFPDHHWYDARDVAALVAEARAAGANCLLTTEKDAVRFPPCALPVTIAVLDFEPLFPADAARLDDALYKALR